MNTNIIVERAYYGTSPEESIDIQSYIQQHYHISKNVNINSLFPDPVYMKEKHICVHWKVEEEGFTDVVESRINLNQKRIGYNSSYKKLVDFPQFYSYEVVEASFEIHSVEVKIHDNPDEITISIPKEKWQGFLKPTEFMVDDGINLVEWLGGDPAVNRLKVIRVYYKRSARYITTVYESADKLYKDLVIGVELPLYRLNLIYHYYPIYEHPLMDLHLQYLKQISPLFNNKIVISICASSNHQFHQNRVCEVIGHTDILFTHVVNTPILGESTSFGNLLQKVSSLNNDEFTFYAHTKGLGKPTCFPEDKMIPVAIWTEMMYIQCVANIDVVIKENANFGGAFMSHARSKNMKNVHWHYSGSYYWCRQEMLNRGRNFSRHSKEYYSTEYFPGYIWPSEHKCLVFVSEAGALYEKSYYESTWKPLIQRVFKYPYCKKILS